MDKIWQTTWGLFWCEIREFANMGYYYLVSQFILVIKYINPHHPKMPIINQFKSHQSILSIRFFNQQIVGKKTRQKTPWGGANSAYNSCALVQLTFQRIESMCRKGKAVGCWPKSKFPRNPGSKVGFREVLILSVDFWEFRNQHVQNSQIKMGYINFIQFWYISWNPIVLELWTPLPPILMVTAKPEVFRVIRVVKAREWRKVPWRVPPHVGMVGKTQQKTGFLTFWTWNPAWQLTSEHP